MNYERTWQKAGSIIVWGIFIVMMMASQAEAKPQDWVSSDYSFKTIQKLYIYDIDVQKVGDNEFSSKDITLRNLQQILHRQAEERIKAARIVASDLIMDAAVKSSVERYEITSRVVPAHKTTRYRTEKVTQTTEDGKKTTTSYTVPYEVFIPEQTVYTSTVRLRFDVIDAATGETVFSRDDTRADDDSKDLEFTYNQLVKTFYNDLNQKIKKAK